MENEGKEVGKVALGVYWDYIKHIGVWPSTIAFLVLLLSRAFYFMGEWWVASWASADADDQQDIT